MKHFYTLVLLFFTSFVFSSEKTTNTDTIDNDDADVTWTVAKVFAWNRKPIDIDYDNRVLRRFIQSSGNEQDDFEHNFPLDIDAYVSRYALRTTFESRTNGSVHECFIMPGTYEKDNTTTFGVFEYGFNDAGKCFHHVFKRLDPKRFFQDDLLHNIRGTPASANTINITSICTIMQGLSARLKHPKYSPEKRVQNPMIHLAVFWQYNVRTLLIERILNGYLQKQADAAGGILPELDQIVTIQDQLEANQSMLHTILNKPESFNADQQITQAALEKISPLVKIISELREKQVKYIVDNFS
jgi:hypothetical protein